MTEAKKGADKEIISRYTLMRLLQKADRALKNGTEVFEVISKIGTDPSFSSVAHAGMKLTRKALDLSIFDKFKVATWPAYRHTEALKKQMFEILNTFPKKITGEGDSTVTFFDFYGRSVAKISGNDSIYYMEDQTSPADLSLCFARAIWEKMGSPCNMVATSSSKGINFHFESTVKTKLLDSKLSNQIMARIKPFLEKDVGRSVILEGPPGTGKTTIINKVAASFGRRVLSIDASAVNYIGPAEMMYAVRILDPDVLVMNDFDRIAGVSQLLTTIEELNYLKLFMISVNNINRLPKAAIRPGRFDEIFRIEHLDEKVAANIIGMPKEKIPPKIWEDLITWPAAFIAELGKRLTYLGEECLKEEYDLLKVRVSLNENEEES